MLFDDGSFDFVYCSAAFKNFSQPVEALNEMFRVLRLAGQALIVDLRKDATLSEITAYVKSSGRNWLDSWMTKWTFRHVLLKRAYTQSDFVGMAKQSNFGACDFKSSSIGFEARFAKAA
jgi:ubiquinone/menaquinone biosynthesis C-methylase UbiE